MYTVYHSDGTPARRFLSYYRAKSHAEKYDGECVLLSEDGDCRLFFGKDDDNEKD